jgi:hypothetical protein
MNKNIRGISLIVLVITIIVIIILAGSVILSLSQNNPISSATTATFKANANEYNSELSLVLSNKYAVDPTFNPKTFYAGKWDGIVGNISGTVKEYITSMKVTDGSKYIIQQGRLAYVGTDENEKLLAKDVGVSDVYVKNGLVLWFDGADFKNVPQTVNLVDRSVNNFSATANYFNYTPTSGSDGNGGIAFDGINDYISSNVYNDTKTFKQLTYETTFYMNPGINSNYKTLLNINTQSAAAIQASGFLWFYDGSAQIGTAAGTWIVYDFTYPLKVNHMLLTLDTEANVAKFYLNGVLVITDTTKDYADIKITSKSILIGTYQPGSTGHAFLGNIYSVRLYDRILTDAEILQNYTASK